MTRRHGPSGFTLSEMLVSMAASIIVIGGLLTGSVGLQKALLSNEARITHYADQRRVIDYVARDLRRTTEIAITDSGGSHPAGGQIITIVGDTALVLTIPGYYQSENPADKTYDEPSPVQNYTSGTTYGSGTAPAADVTVRFRKAYVASAGCTCFVREEDDVQQIIARQVDDLSLKLYFSADARSCDLEALSTTESGGRHQVSSTYDEVLLRNPPLASFQ